MAERRFGPVNGAGVVVIEKTADQAIEPGALGSTAYTGILKKGPVGKLFRATNRSDFLFKAGGLISESLLPDAALEFFAMARGAGNLWLQRITDGNEKKSSLSVKSREDERTKVITAEAGNAGRWGGKKQTIVDEHVSGSLTATTFTLANPPASLQKDELAGGLVNFKAVPGKSFEILSNTTLGVCTVASDVDLTAELFAATTDLLSIKLVNDGAALGVLFKDGLLKPDEEWGVEVYLIEGGVQTRIQNFTDLSSDPNKSNYFEDVVNNDVNADFGVKLTDLNVGTVNADKRPANLHGLSEALTDTTLTAKIHDIFSNSANLATADLLATTLGADVIEDKITLTVTTAGARATQTLTFGANPDDGDTVTIDGFAITFKTVVADAATEVLIGGSAEATIDNLVAFINASTNAALLNVVFAEKSSASTMELYAQNAGTAGNAITTTSAGGANVPTWGGATLLGGVDQVWSYVSEKMPFLTGLTVITGVAFAAPNDFGFGFTLRDTSRNSTKTFALADTVTIQVCPLEINALAGGSLVPNEAKPRIKFDIVSNTAKVITVKSGSKMTDDASAGDDYRASYVQQLGGGYDGVVDVLDATYEDAYDLSDSILKGLRGKNLGLVKLATPGVTSSSVQQAGVAFAESENWQYRYEIPSSTTTEADAEEFINETLGRNDFAVTHFPSYYKVAREGGGLKLISATGGIHGNEARIANEFLGFHKAAAGVDVILSNALALPDGFEDKVLDEEFLNPQGLNVLKFKNQNLIMWGDRTVGVDTNFKFKHQREYISHVENVFLENFDFIIFALNNADTQELLKSAFVQFFIPELAKGAIVGQNLADAMRLKVDNENNTPATRAAGDLNAELSLQVVDTVERFIITVSKVGVTEALAA